MGKNKFESDIVLGERYVDQQTGVEGVATAIYFFQHACERVQLEYINKADQKFVELVFDAPRLTHVETRQTATSSRPGGPARERDDVRPGPR